jgi:hypothetical protein
VKQELAQKYNVAWFKLAEYVSRKEKERALAIYKLLAHSLNDQAFAAQLEGDLLLAFADEAAFDRYGQAVRFYLSAEKSAEAAAVYEHMITLEPSTDEQFTLIVELYPLLSSQVRAVESTQHMLRWLLGKKEYETVSALLDRMSEKVIVPSVLHLHQELVTAWIKSENPPTDSIMVHVKKIIDYYLEIKQQKQLQTFLITLKMLHDVLYEKACGYMQEGNIKW